MGKHPSGGSTGHPIVGIASLRAVPQRIGATTRSRARPGGAFRLFVALVGSMLLGVASVSMAHAETAAAASGLRRLHDAGGFPPIGVLNDHPQDRGRWIFSYRYLRASSDGLLDGRDPIQPDSILGEPWSEVPTRQTDQAHVMSVAYAPLDRLTFELSLPYRIREQDVLTETGTRTLEARGIGDARFVFVIPFIQNGDQSTHMTAGFTFPTGSIQETDSNGERLHYGLQLGSGTWDAVWGITYTGRHDRLGWGGEVHGVYRIGTNSVGYTQGTLYEASGWLNAMANDWLSFSARLVWSRRTNVRGEDPELDLDQNPANNPYNQGWNRLDFGPGADVYLPLLGGQRFAIEWLFPVFQDVSGPQVERQWTLSAGFQWLY